MPSNRIRPRKQNCVSLQRQTPFRRGKCRTARFPFRTGITAHSCWISLAIRPSRQTSRTTLAHPKPINRKKTRALHSLLIKRQSSNRQAMLDSWNNLPARRSPMECPSNCPRLKRCVMKRGRTVCCQMMEWHLNQTQPRPQTPGLLFLDGNQ